MILFLYLDNWKVEKGDNHFDWSCNNLKVSFDGTRIGRLDHFNIFKGPKVLSVTKPYRKSAGLSIKENKTWYY